jgi:hypothetical protein
MAIPKKVVEEKPIVSKKLSLQKLKDDIFPLALSGSW